MGAYNDRAVLLWSLSGSGLGSTISAAGNSGAWGDNAPATYPSSAISLDPCSDFQLMVYVNGKTSTPTFAVQLSYFDSQGHLFSPTSLNLPVTVTTVPATAYLNAGVRAGSGGSSVYFAFPNFGQVSWTCTGGTVTGTEIELWGK